MLLYKDKKISSNANRLLDERLRSLRPDIKGEKQFFTKILEDLRKKVQETGNPFNQVDFQIAGSFAKNTMLSSHREFDIIVTLPVGITGYLPSIDTKDELRDLIAEILENYYPTVPPNGYNVKIEISNVSIDILPTFSITFNEFIRLSPRDRIPFKGHMSLHHIEFIKNRSTLFQDCCRLVKYWAHGPAHKKYPHYTSSFFLELVTAGSFQVTQQKDDYSAVFEMTLRRIKNIMRRKKWKYKYFAFGDFYKLTPNLRQKYINGLAVLDPVDPDDNLALRGLQAKHLNELVVKSKETLKTWKEEGFEIVFQKHFSRKA